MKKVLFLTILLSCLSSSILAKELTFGEPIVESARIEISTLLANPSEYIDKTVTVTGVIVGVCAKRGCWVDLASDAKFEKLKIKVRDGDMVFPLTTKGRQALATGKLKEIALSLEQTQQHKALLAKRKGESFDIASVTKPMSIYQLVPVGVKILD